MQPPSNQHSLMTRPDTPTRSRRRRRYGIVGIAALTMLVGQYAPSQCAPAPAPAPAPGLSPALQQIVDRTNQQRAAHGLPALSVDGRLNAAAQAHSADQAARDTMSHTGGDGSDLRTRVARQNYAWRSLAENVAMGYPDAPSVMNGWMGSTGHRQNILRASVTQIGVGLAYAADGSPYWTQVFGAQR